MDQILADFAVEEGLDYWDIAVFHEIVQKDEEKAGMDRNFNLHKYTDQQSKDHFRFFPQDIILLCQLLLMPERMTTSNRASASGLEVLCIILKRLSYPCRYLDLEGFFHRPRVELCMLFNLGVNHIDGLFRERLTNPAQPWLTNAKLHEYSAAVHAKGAPLNLCWGFIDGTVRKMCKPLVHQREVYNGHKRVHALKFQSIVTPNGLIANLFGPMPGRRHDAALLNASGLMEYMEANMNTQDGRPFCVYGDPAYPLRPHLQRPHRGQRLTAAQQQQNTEMSRVRQAVEWQFGKIVSLWAFLDFAKNLKLNLSPVGKLYRLGALLTNCHACLYGNQTSEYFGLNPPPLEEYLYHN